MRRVVLACVIAAAILASSAIAAFAAGTLVLSITPMRFEVTADPGAVVETSVTVTNVGLAPLEMTAFAMDFSAADERGRPSFTPSTTQPWSMSAWLRSYPTTFKLAPGEARRARVVIDIPDDAEPGGHYAAMAYRSRPPTGAGSGVSGQVGTLVLVNVRGDVNEAGSLSFISPLVSESRAIPITARFTNDGNVHTKPKGTLTITPAWGRGASESIAYGGENVLPRSSRRFDFSWEEPPAFGLFELRAVASYGSGMTATAGRRWLVVLPWKLILFGLGLFGAGMLAASIATKRGRPTQPEPAGDTADKQEPAA